MRKTKIAFFNMCILLILFIIAFFSVKEIIRKLEPTSMIEISDTRMHYDNDDMGVATAQRYVMVINPPEKNVELKDLMLDYCKKNKDKLEDVNGYKTKKKKFRYFVTFYKEGRGFSRKWRPSLESVDSVAVQIQEHNDNSLGYVVYDSKGSDIISIFIFNQGKDEPTLDEYTVPISFFDE